MKKVLITGKNSYVGNSLEKWLLNDPKKYSIDKISMREDDWMNTDFSLYDVVVHVAGIAHVSTDPNLEEKYYKVNRDLTIEVARKAKSEGVKHFLFLSSIIVYGENISNGVITKDTVPTPSNFYGYSKLQAEQEIVTLNDYNFKVVIIRPPMIYGKESKGNYPKLAMVAKRFPVFPIFENQRSMLHIDNLCEFMKLMIENEENGFFFPQNSEYVKTSEMVKMIAMFHGRKVKFTKKINPIIRVIMKKSNIINKVFGNLVYDKSMSSYKENYQIRSLSESIKLTEGSDQ
ncbi:NAD-dependent epimerase/dehydratase family protein [Sporosarcina thermotolerans]|uniref:NAD-dependent epimerase/dehydratase family protein n=1 Tax=Sporosarcina thermotolerans TaxID=633404 RepID=A0AAW9A9F1_9BACL|nr:NAD-dependent epimerase/dehydratase family protein [Sporosarcina thermotolerans]MDW0116308.1 NAD-dependent epimerase/dehydratase family protein [Sporosarcina thermotolerans]WHT48276.1 NAD-dependent epimerase/dehydratase family protein [Sporosarcina thermotolerans]